MQKLKIARKRHAHTGLRDGASGDLIAKFAEVFVPDFRKAGNQIFGGTANDGAAGVDQISPSVDAAAALGHAFECDPLRQGRSHGVVNPTDALAGNTTGDYVFDF